MSSATRFSRRALLALISAAAPGAALGRVRYGGTLRLALPWPTGNGLDPHALDDPLAALLGPALFDTLYALDAQSRPYAALAAGMPEASGRGARIVLRAGLQTAAGQKLDARDAQWSLTRARQGAAAGTLARVHGFRVDPGNPVALFVDGSDPVDAARALASPVTAIVPRRFQRARPEGTGAFIALPHANGLLLKRNLLAARGPAFLEAIDVRSATDLADALRSFEAGLADVGWLGAGYHRARPGALRFDAGVFGWIVLYTGKEAGSWGAPGVAQRLLDTIPAARLDHLGLSGLSSTSGVTAWGGAPADLLVADDAPQLRATADALAALLTRPGHEIRLAPRGRAEINERRARGNYALLLDFVRALGSRPEEQALSLLTAADPKLAEHPPRLARLDTRQLGQSLSLGVVGELRIAGAHMPGVRGISDWNLPNAALLATR